MCRAPSHDRGTANLCLPSGKSVQAVWLKEISEEDVWDCRDRYDELPANDTQSEPKVLNQDQQDDIQRAHNLKFLQQRDLEAWKQLARGELL